ncbi:hypothetical protein SAMN04488029_0279 [Reichenbachiella faecimaris]|uniref:Uncharacterized protein n=1 Tax=Reichenbachiella faecimaris TaxID=692418 RepID=A0A1W2G5R8_REIFA|nr:hypothetical protein SAMN04488029_0279 [Reichenbachiella faecimaris]
MNSKPVLILYDFESNINSKNSYLWGNQAILCMKFLRKFFDQIKKKFGWSTPKTNPVNVEYFLTRKEHNHC